jgi:putative two-component system response regulator
MKTIRPRLLVVDDAATSRFALVSMLGDRYEVHTAADGRAGVEMAHATLPHLILLDVVMPVMDGFAACRALRANPATHATPIILVTSQDDEWDVQAGYTSGCTDYVVKPADRTELLAKIESWLAAALDGEAA